MTTPHRFEPTEGFTPRVGEAVPLRARFFSDMNGRIPANPDSVAFRTRGPNDTDDAAHVFGEDADVTRPATGDFQMWFAPDEAGWWTFGVRGSGSVGWMDTAIERRLYVLPSALDALTGGGSS